MEIMNLKNWSRSHTLGLIIGIILPILIVPLVILFLSWAQNFYYEQLWYRFMNNNSTMSKMLTLAVLANLGLFYIFLNKEKYQFAMGVILGTVCYLPLIVYFVFFQGMVGKRLYIIAGEASGDLHGSNLMEELLGQQADLDIRFWGGDRMREIGGEPAKPREVYSG